MADNKEAVVFPTATQTPEALKVLDAYEKNSTTALEKLNEAIAKVEAQLKNLQDTRLVVNGQRELVLDMKKRLLAGELKPDTKALDPAMVPAQPAPAITPTV